MAEHTNANSEKTHKNSVEKYACLLHDTSHVIIIISKI